MEIVVCIKRVPETAEADIILDDTGIGIEQEDLVFDINEWDNYAMEAAIQIKEELGGSITVVSLGDEESEDTLRRALAMGADRAVHLSDEAFGGGDPYATARALHGALKEVPFDLLLTGVQAGDDGYGQVGSILAELFNLPHACMVNRLDVHGTKLHVHRELEGGLEEACEIQLPAVLSIQTGINEPRYVSIMGIRKARKKELREVDAQDVGLSSDELGSAGIADRDKENVSSSCGKTSGNVQRKRGRNIREGGGYFARKRRAVIMSGVLVLIEHRQGEIREVSYEMLGKGKGHCRCSWF